MPVARQTSSETVSQPMNCSELAAMGSPISAAGASELRGQHEDRELHAVLSSCEVDGSVGQDQGFGIRKGVAECPSNGGDATRVPVMFWRVVGTTELS